MDPFAEVPTLTMCGNVCTIGKGENRPFDQYPKNVSLRAVEYMGLGRKVAVLPSRAARFLMMYLIIMVLSAMAGMSGRTGRD